MKLYLLMWFLEKKSVVRSLVLSYLAAVFRDKFNY